MSTVAYGDFEWNETKASSNMAKHGVSFEEAATVFADPCVTIVDDGSGTGRLKAIGLSTRAACWSSSTWNRANVTGS